MALIKLTLFTYIAHFKVAFVSPSNYDQFFFQNRLPVAVRLHSLIQYALFQWICQCNFWCLNFHRLCWSDVPVYPGLNTLKIFYILKKCLYVWYKIVFICSANFGLLIYFSRWHDNMRKIFIVRQKTLKIQWRYYLIHTWLHMAMITKTSSNINCTPLLKGDDMFWSCPIDTPNCVQAVDLRGSWSSGSRPPSLFYPTIGNIPIKLSEKRPHSIILPPPWLIVGKVF